jgi:hypothetical protein
MVDCRGCSALATSFGLDPVRMGELLLPLDLATSSGLNRTVVSMCLGELLLLLAASSSLHKAVAHANLRESPFTLRKIRK